MNNLIEVKRQVLSIINNEYPDGNFTYARIIIECMADDEINGDSEDWAEAFNSLQDEGNIVIAERPPCPKGHIYLSNLYKLRGL